jgi:DNA-binding LacI/PurR family transcriptional regulator
MGIHKREEGDVVALGVIKGLQLSDSKISDDFGVVGFNNIPEAAQRGRSA